MPNLPKYETIADIDSAISHLSESVGILNYLGKYSDDIYQAQIYQHTISIKDTIVALLKIKNSLK